MKVVFSRLALRRLRDEGEVVEIIAIAHTSQRPPRLRAPATERAEVGRRTALAYPCGMSLRRATA